MQFWMESEFPEGQLLKALHHLESMISFLISSWFSISWICPCM